jgi:hypothetical protein
MMREGGSEGGIREIGIGWVCSDMLCFVMLSTCVKLSVCV